MEKAEALVAERVAIERSTHKPTHYEPSTAAAKDLDRKVNLKLDFIIVSVLAIDFILCGIDKTNIGYAATTNFAQEANLRRDDISDSVSLLSVTFITLQPFSAALGRRIGPKWYIPLMMLLWGTFCAAHAAVKNRGALIALRLLLGAAEAGFVPTTFHYLSTLYPKYFLGFRLGLFCGMYSIAGAFAGLIAYGVFQIRSSKLYDWQILFVLEGVVSIFMAFVTLLVIPAKLDAAWCKSLCPLETSNLSHLADKTAPRKSWQAVTFIIHYTSFRYRSDPMLILMQF
jgi:MFS family permease